MWYHLDTLKRDAKKKKKVFAAIRHLTIMWDTKNHVKTWNEYKNNHSDTNNYDFLGYLNIEMSGNKKPETFLPKEKWVHKYCPSEHIP